MMDTFILAATSFTIAVSLMITGKKDRLQASFAGLCATIFVSQIAATIGTIFHEEFLFKVGYLGELAIAPAALWFFSDLTRDKSIISRKLFMVFTVFSLCGAVFVFMPLSGTVYIHPVIMAYMLSAFLICYAALLWHVRNLPPSTERRRFGYLLVACPIALILSNMDLLNYLGLNFPEISGIIISLLLYFILLIIAYPQLRELHDFFARSLVIFISTVTGTVIFYLTARFFNGHPPFTGLLVAAFLVVISLSPMRMILRKIFSHFYPESKDVFTSLYEFDEKLEREKALMLSEMAPVVAHEIRNPLGSIKGAAQYLKSEISNQEQQDLLNVIVEGTDRLNNVVSKFLDYARPYQLNVQRQNVNLIVQKVIAIISANQLAETITILQEMDDHPVEADVDEQQFMQVILNVALNAIESMPRGGVLSFCTKLEESDADGEISVTIRDTGKGIAKNDLKDIFKPFFTTKERGVGLGLAICQKIIKEHGGNIRVKSMPDQGTEFVIKLKAAE